MAKNPPRHNLASWFVFKNVHWNWVPFEITKLDLFICSRFSNTVNENRPKHRPKSTISLLNLIQSCHSCSKNVEWTSSSYTDCWRGANLLFLVCSRATYFWTEQKHFLEIISRNRWRWEILVLILVSKRYELLIFELNYTASTPFLFKDL